jgi:hypothetical protein
MFDMPDSFSGDRGDTVCIFFPKVLFNGIIRGVEQGIQVGSGSPCRAKSKGMGFQQQAFHSRFLQFKGRAHPGYASSHNDDIIGNMGNGHVQRFILRHIVLPEAGALSIAFHKKSSFLLTPRKINAAIFDEKRSKIVDEGWP